MTFHLKTVLFCEEKPKVKQSNRRWQTLPKCCILTNLTKHCSCLMSHLVPLPSKLFWLMHCSLMFSYWLVIYQLLAGTEASRHATLGMSHVKHLYEISSRCL